MAQRPQHPRSQSPSHTVTAQNASETLPVSPAAAQGPQSAPRTASGWEHSSPSTHLLALLTLKS